MTQLPDWEEERRQLLASNGPRTRTRTVRVLRGTAEDGQSVWEQEEIRGADAQGRIITLNYAAARHAACGCVLGPNTQQVVCAECGSVICSEHAYMCAWCGRRLGPAHAAVYGRGESQVAYCWRHKCMHYVRKYIIGSET